MFRRFRKLPLEKQTHIVFVGSGAVATALMCGYAFPHTILIEKYKEFMTCYSNGVERQLPDKVLRRFDTACDIVKVNDFQRRLLKPFTVFGQDLFHAGTTKSRFGAYIGIPANFSYDNENQIDKQDIRLKTEAVAWSSPHGQRLQTSLVLTEDEQVFGIAREILMSTGLQPGLNVLYPCWTVFFMYFCGRYLNMKMYLRQRPPQIRYIMYTLLSLFGFGIWALLKDGTQYYYERTADDFLCSLGPEVMSAGIRFYDKILNKNIAIRGLTNNRDVYSSKGNLNFLFRNKHIPLTERKEYFENKLKEFEQPTQSPSETNDK